VLVAFPDGVRGTCEFSADHLPPESVGGRFQVLTCKKCNNDAGGYEAELLRTLQFGSVPNERSQSLLPRTRALHEQSGRSFSITVRRSDKTLHLEFNPNAKQHNKALQQFIKELHAGAFPSLQIVVPLADEQKITRAVLKSTYLLGFVSWGYSFVYSDHGSSIREVLLGNRTYPTRIPAIWGDAGPSAPPKGVSLFRHQGEKKAFLLTLELKTGDEHVMAATLLPNPTATGWADLAELNTLLKAKKPTEVEATTLPATLHAGGYMGAWNLLP
jgi:hypothetical protein